MSDVIINIAGSGFGYNLEREPHPFIRHRRMWFMRVDTLFACPLPSKIFSFYNIVTPLDFTAWLAVAASLVLVSLAGIAINQAYSQAVPGRTKGWSW